MRLNEEQKANLSEELIVKAMQCETPEDLVELAKSEGIELTLDEAEAYLDELDDFELDREQLRSVAGGYCPGDCGCHNQGYPFGPCPDKK